MFAFGLLPCCLLLGAWSASQLFGLPKNFCRFAPNRFYILMFAFGLLPCRLLHGAWSASHPNIGTLPMLGTPAPQLIAHIYLRDRMAKSGWPYSTGCPLLTSIL